MQIMNCESHTTFFFFQDFAATKINYPDAKTGNPPGLFMGLNTISPVKHPEPIQDVQPGGNLH